VSRAAPRGAKATQEILSWRDRITDNCIPAGVRRCTAYTTPDAVESATKRGAMAPWFGLHPPPLPFRDLLLARDVRAVDRESVRLAQFV